MPLASVLRAGCSERRPALRIPNMKPAYPIDGAKLARQILGRELHGWSDYPFVQGEVRALLRQFNCPKTSDSPRANWIVDEKMAQRVQAEINRRRTA